MEKKNLWDKISDHLKNMKWLDRNNEICMIFWRKPQVDVNKVINRYYNLECNVLEWLNSLSPEIRQTTVNYYRRKFVKKLSFIDTEEKTGPPETREEKRFTISSYGVLFEVKVFANHFDQFLLDFIEEGLQGGSELFEEIADDQCASSMHGTFSNECFQFYEEGQRIRNLVDEYNLSATYKAIDFEKDVCPWLKVTYLQDYKEKEVYHSIVYRQQTFIIRLVDCGEHGIVRVAKNDLWEAIREGCLNHDVEAIEIDETICFYCDNAEFLYADKVLEKMIYE